MEIGLVLHSGGMSGMQKLSLCPVTKVNGKWQQVHLGRTSNGPDSSGLKVWVTLPGKQPQQAEVLAKCKGNTEWVVEEGSYKYQLSAQDWLQKWVL